MTIRRVYRFFVYFLSSGLVCKGDWREDGQGYCLLRVQYSAVLLKVMSHVNNDEHS